MDVQRIELIIEKGDSGIWGRVNYNDNLIVEEADNLDAPAVRSFQTSDDYVCSLRLH